MKLWYLKMGNEVPPCLQGVTGELRKRGGARVRAALGLHERDEEGYGNGSVAPVASKKEPKGTRRGNDGNSDGEGRSVDQIDPALTG